VITGVSGCVRDAIKLFKAGGLKPAYTPSVQDHFGTGGLGGGRGMGMGRGRGMGKGMGMGGGGGRRQ
jgi:hypothetical protein